MGPEFATCEDIGRAAKLFPDVTFIVYHSGFELGRREGAYDPADAARGIDGLVKSLADNAIAPNSNVYAELGSTWRMVMRDPTAAAHTLGKLMIMKLRDDYRREQGSAYSLKRFHDKFLSFGAPPIPLVRRMMLREPGEQVL